MSKEAIEAALDAAEAKMDAGNPEEIVDETGEGHDNFKHQTVEEWTANGNDPEKYRGKKAFEDHGKSLLEIKGLRESIDTLTSGFSEFKTTQIKHENERVEADVKKAMEALRKATEDDDVKGALEAQKELNSLEDPAATQPAQAPMGPKLRKYLTDNPLIDPSSAQFDTEIGSSLAGYQTDFLNKLSSNGKYELSDDQVARALNYSYGEVQKLYPDKFKSHRNTRQSAPKPQQSLKKKDDSLGDVEARLKAFDRNSKNPHDRTPTTDMYNDLKAQNPKVAEVYAKNILNKLGG